MMNKKKSQFGVRLMAVLMAILLMLPTMAYAAPNDSAQTDGVVATKTVTVDGDKATVSIDAYVTGETVTTVTTTPVDVVLVIDQSSSMSQNMGSSTRQAAMQNAVTSFIDSVAEKHSADSQQKMAIVTFGNNASTVSNWTTVDAAGARQLKNRVTALTVPSNQATRVDRGMDRAQQLLNSADNTPGREKIVIVFTDGEPTTSNTFSTTVANSAISTAQTFKNNGVKVYAVGIFDNADPSQLYGTKYRYAEYAWWDVMELFPEYVEDPCDGTVNSRWGGEEYEGNVDLPANNRFMNYLSSNYPTASNLGATKDESTWTITTNYNRGDGTYYFAANNASALADIFQTISNEIGQADASLDSTTVVRDIIDECFTLPEGADADSIQLSFIPCTDGQTEGTPTSAEGARAIVNGKSVEITGFDFAKHYVPTSGTNAEGGKLRVTFDIVIDQETARAGTVTTNGEESGLYMDGKLFASLDSGIATINSITWKGEDGQTLGTKYIFKGGTVPAADEVTAPTVENKTFKEWKTTTDDDGNITYTATYERTVLNYTIDYQYDGQSIKDQTGGTVNAGDSVDVTAPEIDGYKYVNATLNGNPINDLSQVAITENDNAIVLNYDKVIDYTIQYVDEDGEELAEATSESTAISSGDTATVEVEAKAITNYTYDSAKNGNNTISDLTNVEVKDGDTIVLTYKKTVLSYTIDYMYDGQSIKEQISGTVNAGETVDIDAPEISGYVYADATLEGEAINDLGEVAVTADKNTIILNYHKKLSYNVEYADEDGKWILDPEIKETTISSGDTATVEVKAKAITNYTYDSAKNGDTAISDLTNVEVKDGDIIVLTYKKTVLNYTVDYMYDGQSIKDQTSGTVNAGETVNIDAPEISGYVYADATLEGEAIKDLSEVAVAADKNTIILNYHKKLSYNVEYADEDGEWILDPEIKETTISSGDTATVKVNQETIPNYTYDSAKNGNTAISDLTSVEVKDGDTIVLTYKKTVLSYTIDYMYDGESISAQTSGTVNAGDSVSVTALDIDGYKYVNATLNGNPISDLSQVAITENDNAIVLNYDKVIAYTIQYVDEDGEEIADATSESTTISRGDSASVEVEAKAITNYTYDSAKNGDTAISDLTNVEVKDGDTIVLTYSKTVLSYTVEYMYGGESIQQKISGTINAGETVSLTEEQTKVDGYIFDNATLGQATLNSLSNIPVTADNNVIVLNYKKALSYTVKYVDENGEALASDVTEDITITSGDTATVEIEDKVFDGYTRTTAKLNDIDIDNLSEVEVADGDVITVTYSQMTISYTIAYVDEDGEPLLDEASVTVASMDGETGIMADVTIPAITGYIYVSNDFNLEQEGDKLLSGDTSVTEGDVITLTFQPAEISYTVHYMKGNSEESTVVLSATPSDDNVLVGLIGEDDIEIISISGYRYSSNTYVNADGEEATLDENANRTALGNGTILDGGNVYVNYTKRSGGGGNDVDWGLSKARLTKVDANDNDTTLSGAKFELYSVDDNRLIGTYTTDADGFIEVADLRGGNYYWKEIVPPSGYTIESDRINFILPVHGEHSVTVTNTKSDMPEVFSDEHEAYISGYPDGSVQPQGNITRAEVAMIFYRLLDKDVRAENESTTNRFSDVNEGEWYNIAVSTIARMGIISGYEDGTFRPNKTITRAEFAAIAARFDENSIDTEANFTDLDGHWAAIEIAKATNRGWVSGYEDGTFRPNRTITRAEAISLVNRVTQRLPEDLDDLLRDDMITFWDNTNTSTWYYIAVQESANGHDYERKTNGYEFWTALNN